MGAVLASTVAAAVLGTAATATADMYVQIVHDASSIAGILMGLGSLLVLLRRGGKQAAPRTVRAEEPAAAAQPG